MKKLIRNIIAFIWKFIPLYRVKWYWSAKDRIVTRAGLHTHWQARQMLNDPEWKRMLEGHPKDKMWIERAR